ncbi:MAG TPA: hypothetical protein VEB22_11260 [Phycisphaerales bacterium]|nr:hypothetical protein [Phycisphaerales bacterium]
MATVYDLGPENIFGTPDGEDAQTLRDRAALALLYIANWYKATDESESRAIWWAQIDQVRAKVENAFRLVDPAQIFPGRTAKAAYIEAANSFVDLWRKLTLSADTLPQPSLIDRAAGYLEALGEAPLTLVPQITNAITKAVGGALGAALGNLWPYLAIAGAGLLVYTFRDALGLVARKAVA